MRVGNHSTVEAVDTETKNLRIKAEESREKLRIILNDKYQKMKDDYRKRTKMGKTPGQPKATGFDDAGDSGDSGDE